MKVLIATEKPFASAAVEGIRKEIEGAGYELALLEKYTDKQQLLDAVADVDALIIRSDKVDNAVLEAAKNLKIVVRAGAGYDNVDLAAATAHGVVVMNTPGQNSNAVAELVFGLLVYAVRNFYNGKTGTELKGKKLGILAFGNVGRNVARIAKGFDMDVYAYDAYCPADVIESAGVKAVASTEELFEKCDIVSLHIPANEEKYQLRFGQKASQRRHNHKYGAQGSCRRRRAHQTAFGARGFALHIGHSSRQGFGICREVPRTLFCNTQEDGSADRRSKHKRRNSSCVSDSRLPA